MVFLPLLSSQLQIPQHKGQWSQTPWLLPAKRSVKRQAHHIWLNWTYYSIQFHQFHQCSSCNGVLQEVCLQKIRIRNKPSTHQGNVCMATSSAKKNVATPALGMENHGSAPSRFASSTICSTQTPNLPCQWLQVQKTSRFYVALCCFHLLSSTVSFANLCQTWMSKYVLQARHLLVSDLLVVSCSPSFGFGIHHVPIHPQAKKGSKRIMDWLIGSWSMASSSENGATNFRWQGATICQRENRSSVVPFSISKKRGWKSCVVAFCA